MENVANLYDYSHMAVHKMSDAN